MAIREMTMNWRLLGHYQNALSRRCNVACKNKKDIALPARR
jgi:hypothetical protein